MATEAMTVIGRLDRIRALDEEGAPARLILAELRELLVEAEAYALEEGGDGCVAAVDRLRRALTRDMIAV